MENDVVSLRVISQSDIMKWDGSDITNQISNIDRFETYHGTDTYLSLKFPDKYVHCIIRSCISSVSNIIDELKPSFGLQKIGTHQLMIGSKRFILFRVYLDSEGNIITYNTLKTLIYDDDDMLFRCQVQLIFAFRELFGIKKTYESSIRIRSGKLYSYPISFYEPNVTYDEIELIMSDKLLNKWFYDISLDECVKKLLNITKVDDIGDRLMKINDEMESVITRLDRTQIAYRNLVMARIGRRVQSY
jgi:hypothetical protein